MGKIDWVFGFLGVIFSRWVLRKCQKRKPALRSKFPRRYELYSGTIYQLEDIEFEMASVLYNIGALHSHLGAAESRTTSDSMKVACTHFQCAAWAFHTLPDRWVVLMKRGFLLLSMVRNTSANASYCLQVHRNILSGPFTRAACPDGVSVSCPSPGVHFREEHFGPQKVLHNRQSGHPSGALLLRRLTQIGNE